MHIINFFVATKELQNVILSNNLINLLEKSNNNFKINQLLKLLNFNLKTF